jgi:hypothetical protein
MLLENTSVPVAKKLTKAVKFSPPLCSPGTVLSRTRKPARSHSLSSVPRRPEGYFNDALTPEDIALDNQLADAVAKMNARHKSA